MPQQNAWEREYRNPQLLTKEAEPQKDVRRFLKFMKKQGVAVENLSVLDLGCGTGRNANYIAELGNTVVGFDISSTALDLAMYRAKKMDVDVVYTMHNIGSLYPYPDNTFDLAIDVTSSNSLNPEERALYLSEVHRVLKQGSFFFVKGLCKDGDTNAKELIKKYPGPDPDTYINMDMNLIERVFSRQDFVDTYAPYFDILFLEKKTTYTRFNGRSYKRNFWLAYMKKK